MESNRYAVDITLEVEADTGQLAVATARAAGKSLQGLEGIAHATLDLEARPLFDAAPFRQMRGQIALDT